MLSTRSPILYLLSLAPLCHGWEDLTIYKPYPAAAIELLENTTKLLKDKAPKVQVLVTLPGSDTFEKIQEVAVRNSQQNPLFDLDVLYLMEDGLNIGCRFANEGAVINNVTGRTTDTHSFQGRHNKEKAAECLAHCTHHGRYCPVFPPAVLKQHTNSTSSGHDLVLEVLRRLCLGNSLDNKFANPMFFEYIKGFTEYSCLGPGVDLATCSKRVFDNKLTGFPSGDNSHWARCVSQAEAAMDKPNQMLEDSLDVSALLNKKYSVDQLPIMEIAGKKYTGMIRADHILQTWCNHFQGAEVQPVACDFCLKECSNRRDCLWQLRCDSKEFDIATYKDPKNKHPHAGEPPLQIMEEVVVEDATAVARGTGEILAFGIVIGFIATGVLWCMVELKRSRAVAQVRKELPIDGFKDNSEHELELPQVS